MIAGCIHPNVACNVDCVWCRTKAEHLRVKPERDVELVCTWQKQKSVAFAAELAVLLLGIDTIDAALHLSRRSGGGINKDVWTEGRGWSGRV